MDGQPLWVLCDYFQRWVPGFPGDSRWVRQSDAEAAVAAERASIRAEFLAWYSDKETEELFTDALDRILPEKE